MPSQVYNQPQMHQRMSVDHTAAMPRQMVAQPPPTNPYLQQAAYPVSPAQLHSQSVLQYQQSVEHQQQPDDATSKINRSSSTNGLWDAATAAASFFLKAPANSPISPMVSCTPNSWNRLERYLPCCTAPRSLGDRLAGGLAAMSPAREKNLMGLLLIGWLPAMLTVSRKPGGKHVRKVANLRVVVTLSRTEEGEATRR